MTMTMIATGWKYYLPEDGYTTEDAIELRQPYWALKILDAEEAAELAAEEYWNDSGWERGIDAEPVIVIIAPDGIETRWKIYHEPTVIHSATKIDEGETE